MPNIRIEFNVRRPTGLANSSQVGSVAVRYLKNALDEVLSGKNQSDGVLYSSTDVGTLGDIAYAGPAIGLLAMATSSGAVGGTIGGTLITVTWATSDILSCTALAAAIRASATHNRKVTATSVSMRLTIASVLAGQFVDIAGVRFTAVDGTPANFGEFNMAGTDTQDAASLALAINRHPSSAARFRAVSAAGLVYIFPSTSRVLTPTQDKWSEIVNTGSFSTFTLTQRTPAAGNAVAVLAVATGDIGNEVRSVASGTNVTAITAGSAGFLGGGTGGGPTLTFVLP